MSSLMNNEETVLYIQNNFEDDVTDTVQNGTSDIHSGMNPVVVVVQTKAQGRSLLAVKDVETQNRKKRKLLESSCTEGVNDKLECGLCHSVFVEVLIFLRHKANHTVFGSTRHKCELCGLLLPRETSLMEHYSRKHQLPMNDIASTTCLPSTVSSRVVGNDYSNNIHCNKRVIADSRKKTGYVKVANKGTCSRISKKKKVKSEDHQKVLTQDDIGTKDFDQSVVNDINSKADGNEIFVAVACEKNDEDVESDGFVKEESVCVDENLISEGGFYKNADGSTNIVGHDLDHRLIELKYSEHLDVSVPTSFNGDSECVAAGSRVIVENVHKPEHCAEVSVEDVDVNVYDSNACITMQVDQAPNSLDLEPEAGTDRSKTHLDIEQQYCKLNSANVSETTVANCTNGTDESSVLVNSTSSYTEHDIQPSGCVVLLTNAQAETTTNGIGLENCDFAQSETIHVTGDASEDKKKSVPGVEQFNVPVFNLPETCQRVSTRSSVRVKHKPAKTIPQELDMPDFYFIHRIEQLGQNVNNPTTAGRDQFVCILCGEKANWRRTICRHMREKHGTSLNSGEAGKMPDNFEGQNGKLIKMSDYVSIEIKDKRLRPVEKQDLPGLFSCEKCGKMFNRLRNLRRHHQVCHTGEKDSFLCAICVKTFKTASYLKQHMKVHTEDRKAYKCSECDFTSTINIAIHKHRQLHSKNSIICEICGSAYIDRSTLAKHMRVHDQSRPFQCSFRGCTWRFHTQSMCNAHIEGHTNKGTFTCSVCGYNFRKKHHLHRHETVVHNLVIERPPAFKSTNNKDDTQSNEFITEREYVTQEDLVIDENNENKVEEASDNQFDMNVEVDIQNALQSGQLVIATDDCNMNYMMSDMNTNIVYQTLLQDGDGNQLDSQTILLPEGSQILYQQDDMPGTVHSEIEINNEQET